MMNDDVKLLGEGGFVTLVADVLFASTVARLVYLNPLIVWLYSRCDSKSIMLNIRESYKN